MTPHHRLQSYYGYSFESYCTSSHPTQRDDATNITDPRGWGGDVDTNVQWCAVVKTKLGTQRIVIGGEVDCVRGSALHRFCVFFSVFIYIYPSDKFTGSTSSLVELKTSLTIRGPNDEAKFEKWVTSLSRATSTHTLPGNCSNSTFNPSC